MITTIKRSLGGKDLIVETGHLAKQASGAVTVRYGGSMVLSTAVVSAEPRDKVDFLPLMCEYQEKTYAAGKIPGGFFKREGRPSGKATLSSRMIDRPIRPLFPKGFRNEIQVVSLVLSVDGENDTDILAMIGSFCALAISPLPYSFQVGAVRVGLVDGKYVVNPTFETLEKSKLNLIVAANKDSIVMVEAGAHQASEDEMLEALRFGQSEIRVINELQEELVSKAGKPKKEYEIATIPTELVEKVRSMAEKELETISHKVTEKHEREERVSALAKTLCDELVTEGGEVTKTQVKEALRDIEKKQVRRMILDEKRRADGRAPDVIRPITCQVGYLPRTHGSALFTRGQTQALAATTLGGSDDEQRIDAIEGESFKRFMLHYNFPSFSVGEVRPIRGPGRREIGHGALAERALLPVMPGDGEFPYVVRLVSDILESNGSSSMATVCSGSMALMDAGVPIKKPVSGIAMGLVKEGDQHAVLTDIAGLEDHVGDMDFKVTGTEEGITALQMDIKIAGVTQEIMKEALEQARKARLDILKKMNESIAKPRTELSPYAPRIVEISINPEKIGALIGPGGKIIRKISEETGCDVNVEDDGKVQILSTSPEESKKAVDWVKSIVDDPEIGKIYEGHISRMMRFGAFAEFMNGKEGLIHVSELSGGYANTPEDIVKIGDPVKVKVIEVDRQGRINLSRKQALTPEELKREAEAHPQGDRPPQRPRPDRDRGFGRDRGGGGFRSDRGGRSGGPSRSGSGSHDRPSRGGGDDRPRSAFRDRSGGGFRDRRD